MDTRTNVEIAPYVNCVGCLNEMATGINRLVIGHDELHIQIDARESGPRMTLRGELDEGYSGRLRSVVQEVVTRGSRMVTFDLRDVLLLNEKAIELVSELTSLCLAHSSSVEVLMTAASFNNARHRTAYLKNFLLGEFKRNNVATSQPYPSEPVVAMEA